MVNGIGVIRKLPCCFWGCICAIPGLRIIAGIAGLPIAIASSTNPLQEKQIEERYKCRIAKLCEARTPQNDM
jgi:hypothetical protein